MLAFHLEASAAERALDEPRVEVALDVADMSAHHLGVAALEQFGGERGVDEQPCLRLHDSDELGQRPVEIIHLFEHIAAPDEVEVTVLGRQVVYDALVQGDAVAEAGGIDCDAGGYTLERIEATTADAAARRACHRVGMFRQVVMHRWPSATTEEDRAGYRQAMERLREVPELTSLRYGDDVGRFDGNHDFVAVLDFPDFDAARRYVASAAHRSFGGRVQRRRRASRRRTRPPRHRLLSCAAM